MHGFLAPLCNLIHDDVLSHLINYGECMFINAEQTLTHNCELILPNTQNLFFIMIDASAIGVGNVLVQPDDRDRMHSFNITLLRLLRVNTKCHSITAIDHSFELYQFTK